MKTSSHRWKDAKGLYIIGECVLNRYAKTAKLSSGICDCDYLFGYCYHAVACMRQGRGCTSIVSCIQVVVLKRESLLRDNDNYAQECGRSLSALEVGLA